MEIDWYTHHLNDGGGGWSGGIHGSGAHMFEISSIEQKQKLWHKLCIEFPTELFLDCMHKREFHSKLELIINFPFDFMIATDEKL